MLPTKLYLDTARLGQTSPSALQAQIDFARLTAEDPSSLYFEKFLRDGVDACPEIADRFPGLAHWHGISDLKRRLASMAGAPDQLRVLLANRSAELMTLAARSQIQVCRNVLVTDLSWPTWLAILKEEAERAGGRVTIAHISRAIMRNRCSSDDVCDHLSRVYATYECDGLFLPIVSNLGVHLPVAKIVTALRTVGPVNYTIADGAQALNHVDLTEPMKVSDFIVAGCHKWLRAGIPMGVGLFPAEASHNRISESCESEVGYANLNDPLLMLIQQLENGRLGGYSETVNLGSLFSCSGAISHVQRRWSVSNCRLPPGEAEFVAQACEGSNWIVVEISDSIRSNITLIRPDSRTLHELAPSALRAVFSANGIAISAYPDGIVRISGSSRSATDGQADLFRTAVNRIH